MDTERVEHFLNLIKVTSLAKACEACSMTKYESSSILKGINLTEHRQTAYSKNDVLFILKSIDSKSLQTISDEMGISLAHLHIIMRIEGIKTKVFRHKGGKRHFIDAENHARASNSLSDFIKR